MHFQHAWIDDVFHQEKKEWLAHFRIGLCVTTLPSLKLTYR